MAIPIVLCTCTTQIEENLISAFTINSTEINEQFCKMTEGLEGCASRWIYPSQFVLDTHNVSVLALIVNQTNEINIGLDKKQPSTHFIHGPQVVVSESLLSELGGNTDLLLSINILELLTKNLGYTKTEMLEALVWEVLETVERSHPVMNAYVDPNQRWEGEYDRPEPVEEAVTDWKQGRKAAIAKWR